MTCNEIEERLPAYRANLLLPEEKECVAEHLAVCDRCSRVAADLEKSEALVKGLSEVEPPPFFEQRIMSRVREESGRKQGLLRRLFYPLRVKVPIQALATLLIAVLAFYVYEQGGPEMKQMAPLPLPVTGLGQGPITGESAPSVGPPAQEGGNGQAATGTPPSASSSDTATAPALRKGAAAGESPAPRAAASVVAPVQRTRELGKGPFRVESAPSPGDSAVAPQALRTPAGDLSEKDVRRSAALPFGSEGKVAGSAGSPATMQEAGPTADGTAARLTIAKEEATPQAQRRRRPLSAAGAAGEESRKSMSAPAPAPLTGATGVTPPGVDLTIQVRDVEAALRETEVLLDKVGARVVERQQHEGSEFLKAEIAGRDIAVLLERLAAIGQVNPGAHARAIPGEVMTVDMTIIRRP